MSVGGPEFIDPRHLAGLYVFCYIYGFNTELDGGKMVLTHETWMWNTFANGIDEAVEKMHKAAKEMGFLEELKQHPQNMAIQSFHLEWLDEGIERLLGNAVPPAPKVKDADMVLKTEEEYVKDHQKNALMKQILAEQNIDLLHQHHTEFSAEEVQYLHDKLTRK